MARPASTHPTELELEILKILWRDGPATVRHVREALGDQRKLAHTTVMTMMTIMTDKGYLRRRKTTGGYRYEPKLERESTASRMIQDVVKRAFDGSTKAAVLQLIETGDIEEGELQELRRLIARKVEEQK